MTNNHLKNIIHDIYESYEPMNHMSQRLFNEKTDNELHNILTKKTDSLEKSVQKRIYDEVFNWGPLESIRYQEDIFDIIINGPEDIYYETSSGMHQLKDSFLSSISFKNFTEEIFKKSQIMVSQKTPFGNGKINPFRVHAVTSPITKSITLTLRRHRPTVISLSTMAEENFFSTPQKDFLYQIINNRKNFLVIGPTGSGKTTFLNSIIHSLHHFERVVIVEDLSLIHI